MRAREKKRGVDENAVNTSVELMFSSIDGSFYADAHIISSGFRIIPLDSGITAQVHRAKLINGQKLVVKVQNEGVKGIILENANSIADWIAWAEPQYDFNPMIDEWCKEAPKELDFNTESEIEIYCAPTAYSSDVWQTSMTHIALEGVCFVLSANQFCRRKDELTPDSIVYAGGSVIISPYEAIIEGLNYDDDDRLILAYLGHYMRPEVLNLIVRDHASKPVTFTSASKKTEDTHKSL